METFETLFAFLLFTVRQGLQAALWTGLGAIISLLVAGSAMLLLTWSLRRFRWSRERSGTRALVVAVCCLMALPLLIAAGTLVGAGRATANLIEEDALLEEVGELALDGATSALERARSSHGGDHQEEVALGLRLVRGEEAFPISSLGELLQSFSQSTLESALSVYDEQVGITLESQPFGEATLAQSAGRRFLVYLHGRSQQFGASWLAPVLADLEARDVTSSGEATGREMALAIARVHVQRPIARFTFLSFALSAASIAAFGLAPLVLVPFAAWLLLRLFGSHSTDAASP